MTRASVIIVIYNSREDLSHCLPALMPTISTEDEVIIVDNGSEDDSIDWLSQSYPTIQIFQSKGNLGYGGGNNLGAHQANGNYLVFLNPDTIVSKNWLNALINPLEKDPEIGMTTSKILLTDHPDKINTCGNAVHISGITLTRGLNRPSTTFSSPENINSISGAAFAIPNDLFTKLGGFDENFFMYMEDTDLSWRAQLSGADCLFVPTSVVHHKYLLRFGPKKVFYQERNRYLMLLKTYKWLTLIILLPTLILAEIITWGFVLLNDRANISNKIHAYQWIIKNWEIITHKRYQTQFLRRNSDRTLLRKTTFRLEFSQTGNNVFTRLSNIIFNPLFWVLRLITLALVWW